MAKLKEVRFQRMIFLVSAMILFILSCYTNNVQRSSYIAYNNGDLNSISGSTVHFSHRTGEETQNIHFYEDIYQNGTLFATNPLMSLGVGGEVYQSELSVKMVAAPNLTWTLNAGGAVTYWITELEDASDSKWTSEHLQTRKQALTGEDNLVLAAVFQNPTLSSTDGYLPDCETILNDLDAVIAKYDTVVLIRMVTSKSDLFDGTPSIISTKHIMTDDS